MVFLKKKFLHENNIYKFDIKDKVTKSVTDFYKIKPFPNYKSGDNKATLLSSGDKNYLASNFKKFSGFKKKVLEVGCGTGQLSIYFSIGTNNEIVGLDPTIESLNLASNFSIENNIQNVKFVNADIFDDVLEDEYFDFVWCNGVLHHTKNPYEGFKIILKSLKNNGYILIGLYNKIGRVRTIIRKYIYKIFGKKTIMIMDPVLRNLKSGSPEQIDSWIRDQYIHPVESLHTFDEVFRWFKKNNVEFISSIPQSHFDFHNTENLFEKQKPGNFLTRLFNQILMIFNYLGSDGGLFVFIGKKNE